MRELLLLSGVELARRVKSRDLTSREIVEAYIGQIERCNPRLNAMVATRFDEARVEADSADRQTKSSDPANLPEFHGIPCSIKESFALTGMPNTAGLLARKHHRSPEDGVTVARYRKAGAIPLGVTNTSELCMWMESTNQVYGRSRNPYDQSRIVGGSSGGEAAIVAASGAPFGLGSDIGGSIRMPAFFNGIFGHKPSGGLVPGSGQFPLPVGRANRMLATGPLTRHSADLLPLLKILRGPDGHDRHCEDMFLGDPDSVMMEGLRVIDVRGNGIVTVDAELDAAQRRAASALSARGAQVVSANIPQLRHSLEIWSAMMHVAGGPSFSEMLGNGRPIHIGRQLLAWSVGRSAHTLPALGLALVEKVPNMFPGRTKKALALREELADAVNQVLGPDGVMLFPSYPKPAPKHVTPLFLPIQWAYTCVFNALELPVTQVPLGLSRDGLPLGVQVVGRHGQDHRTLAVAKVLEDAFGGWVPPPVV